jgi:hypothetical protein
MTPQALVHLRNKLDDKQEYHVRTVGDLFTGTIEPSTHPEVLELRIRNAGVSEKRDYGTHKVWISIEEVVSIEESLFQPREKNKETPIFPIAS